MSNKSMVVVSRNPTLNYKQHGFLPGTNTLATETFKSNRASKRAATKAKRSR